MPKRTRGAKGGKPKKLSERSKQRLVEIGKREQLSVEVLNDFDVQAKKLMKNLVGRFRREAKKESLVEIPTKLSLNQELSNMSLYEFKRRGNTLPSVLESIKLERQQLLIDDHADTDGGTGKPDNSKEVDLDFVTPAPAMSTRRTARRQCTIKRTTMREPRPCEEVNVSVQSKATGSPVDSGALFKMHTNDTVEGMGSLMVDRLTALLPQCHRSKVMRAIKEIKAEVLTAGRDITKTPALVR